MKVHCFFEQSGTFKNEFKKLGIEAIDYDILDEFNETDNIIDLYKEIEKAYEYEKSIFDNISKDDLIMAFFPCIRFEDQIQMHFRGTAFQMKNWSDIQKIEKDIDLHRELSQLYELISKLAIVCLKRGLKLIIENPYSEQHYLVKFWSIKSKIIDKDRTQRGDYFEKPTQYWFINCEPKQNMILEAYTWNADKKKSVEKTNNKTERSLIAPEYANRFIREFILEEEIWKTK